MTKFLFKFKKALFLAYFWPISLIFGAKKFFPENFGSVMYNCISAYGYLESCQNSEKSNDPIPIKHPDR